MTIPALVPLQAGDLRLQLCPALGGAIYDFTRADKPVFRVPAPDSLETLNARHMGCFALLPYSNRIANGRFSWNGRDYQLDHNFPDDPNTIHGVGWQQRWSVLDSGPDHARLGLRYDPAEAGLYTWPFRLSAELDYRLDPDGLTTTISVRNEDSVRWPAGLGLHPHFPRTDDLLIAFGAERVWTRGPHSMPIQPEPIPPEWNYARPSPVRPPMLDNCFEGWQGEARLRYPGLGHTVQITADAMPDLVMYTPDGKPYVALEPVTHLPDAINRGVEAGGLVVIAPGETLTRQVRIAVLVH